MISKIMPMHFSSSVSKKYGMDGTKQGINQTQMSFLSNKTKKVKDVAAQMSAVSFLGIIESEKDADEYEKTVKKNAEAKPILDNGKWYKPHCPVDDSDYFHYVPCDPPTQKYAYEPCSDLDD